MVRVIVSATLIVLLAVLVAFNLRFTTSISIYGAEFTGVPVMVIALLSFALGVVYSLFIYVGRYLGLRRRGAPPLRRADDRHEQSPAAQVSAAPPVPDPVPPTAPGDAGAGSDASAPSRRRRLFRRGGSAT